MLFQHTYRHRCLQLFIGVHHEQGIQSDAPSAQNPPRRELSLLRRRRVPTDLTLDEAEDRIFIREFLFRFGDISNPPAARCHLEDLEALGGRLRKNDAEDDVPSLGAREPCLKAVLIGLLGLLAQDRGEGVSKVSLQIFKKVFLSLSPTSR